MLMIKGMDSNKQLLWLTTFPNPDVVNFDLKSIPNLSIDRRAAYNFKLYAAASIDVAEEMDVPYLDVHSMCNVLRDASYDCAHYKAPVGYEMALVILHKAYELLNF